MTNRFKLLLIVNIILLLLINMSTIKHPAVSGNGNPALLFIFPLFPLALWFAIEWVKWLPAILNTAEKRIAVGMGSVAVLIVGTIRTVYEIRHFKPNFREAFLQKYSDFNPDYVEIMTDGLTIFTNTLYFNFTTFLMFLAGCSLLVVPNKHSFAETSDEQ